MQPKLFALDLLNLARLIRKMGSKKKKVGRKWGERKSAHFFKTRKNGKKKKIKKMGAKWGDKKNSPIFKKWERSKLKKWENAR